jgi:hypothetical protein
MADESTPKRIKLNLDDLTVDSFDTLPGGKEAANGTVRAFETDTCWLATYPCYGTGCYTCEETCGGVTCDGGCGGQTQTCGLTAQSCGCGQTGHFTCSPACASAETYASCGGSCEATDCPGQSNCTLDEEYCREA